jgi:hypothetical protein
MLSSEHDLRVVDDVEGEDDGSNTRVHQVQDTRLQSISDSFDVIFL